jgi:hypothetical protein
MPSVSAMSIMTGAALGGAVAGRAGWRHSGRNPDLDKEDRFALTTSSVIAGVAGGAVLGKIGLGNLTMGAKAAGRGMMGIGRAAKGIGPAARSMGAGKAPWLKGPMKPLALLAAGVGLLAYGARSQTPTSAYASRDEAGGREYNQHSVKERMSMMGVTGEMVFGMNNTRHG